MKLRQLLEGERTIRTNFGFVTYEIQGRTLRIRVRDKDGKTITSWIIVDDAMLHVSIPEIEQLIKLIPEDVNDQKLEDLMDLFLIVMKGKHGDKKAKLHAMDELVERDREDFWDYFNK